MTDNVIFDQWDRASGLCKTLAKVGDEHRDDEPEMLQRALDACKQAKLSYQLFRALDERPGTIGYEVKLEGGEGRKAEWHWVLRRLRNHKEKGVELFDSLQKKPY